MFDVDFKPRFLVSDAWKATANSVKHILPDTQLLMCYFHVKHNVRKWLKGSVDRKIYDSVMSDISALYDCMTQVDYNKLLRKTGRKWRSDESLVDFHDYFFKEWVNSSFSKWQLFWTDPGMAHTNSPIESYNKQIKYSFTRCIKHSMRR